MIRKQGMALATAALFLSFAARAEEGAAAAPADGTAAKIECHGVNACKGQGECGGKGHSCAGKNACKGKGFKMLSKAECKAQHGKAKKHKQSM